jgi:hypothetical protein
MTRVAGIPEQLRGVASSLHGTAGDLEALAGELSGISYPEMPPDTAGVVIGLVTDAGGRLRRDAIVADSAGGDIKNRALWFEFADALLSAPVFKAVHESSDSVVNALDAVEARRVEQMLGEWRRWNRVVPEIIDEYGADSGPATSIWFSFQERSPLTYDQLMRMLAAEGSPEDLATAADVPLAAFRGVAGKFLGPLGIITNGLMLIDPEHSGWRGDVDRVSGGLGVVASGTATAMALGLSVPGLDVAVGGVLLGVAAWQVGNLIYDNRKAIASAAVSTAKYVYDHAGWIGGPLGQLAWEHRSDAVHGIVSAGEWGFDHALGVANTGLNAAQGAFHDVTHPISTVEKIGHGLDELGSVFGGI